MLEPGRHEDRDNKIPPQEQRSDKEGLSPEQLFEAKGMKFTDLGFTADAKSGSALLEPVLHQLKEHERDSIVDVIKNLQGFLAARLLVDTFKNHDEREAWKNELSVAQLYEFNQNRLKANVWGLYPYAVEWLTIALERQASQLDGVSFAIIQKAVELRDRLSEIQKIPQKPETLSVKALAKELNMTPAQLITNGDLVGPGKKYRLSDDSKSITRYLPGGYDSLSTDEKRALILELTESAKAILYILGYKVEEKNSF